MSRPAALLLAGLTMLAGCMPAVTPKPQYELGKSYQVKGFWYYPAENYALNETGLAAVFSGPHAPLTANGELFDQDALIIAHPTLQLPAIARLTNLETGSSLVVRVNDRGTGNPHRLVEVSRRVATLLNIRAATPVRLEVLAAESQAAIEGLAGVPSLALTTAPRDAIKSDSLAPPSGVREGGGRTGATLGIAAAPTVAPAAAVTRLPEVVTQGPRQPSRLWVRLDTFEEYQYAAIQRAKLAYLGATIESAFDRRSHRFWVRVGPMETVRQADDTLDAAFAAGIPDARIVAE